MANGCCKGCAGLAHSRQPHPARGERHSSAGASPTDTHLTSQVANPYPTRCCSRPRAIERRGASRWYYCSTSTYRLPGRKCKSKYKLEFGIWGAGATLELGRIRVVWFGLWHIRFVDGVVGIVVGIVVSLADLWCLREVLVVCRHILARLLRVLEGLEKNKELKKHHSPQHCRNGCSSSELQQQPGQ